MSIDDLARSSARDLRRTAADTFDLDGGLASIPASSRRRTIAQQGTALVMVVLVMVVGAITVRPHLGAAPEPVTSQTPAPSVSQQAPMPTPVGPFEALVIRDSVLVAVDAHGHERRVRDLAALNISPSDMQFAYVSNAGWLALEPGGGAGKGTLGHEFINLLDPQARPVLVSGSFDQRTWSPDGTRLATTESGTGTVVIDAATGVRTRLDQHGQGLPGGGPSVIWTADGTGIVVADSAQPPGWTSAHLYVAPVDGGPLQDAIPELWERERHSITAGGLQLDHATCFMPDCPTGLVRVVDPSGAATTLYAGDLPGTRLADATLTGDGHETFLLLAAAAGNEHRLQIALDRAGSRPTVLASVPVVTSDGASLGVSPDDTTLLVATITRPDAAHPTLNYYVVPLDGNPAYAARGTFAGWVPTNVVDAIAAAR